MKILVIEDDFSIRETIREALEFEGYVVTTASNGAEGIGRIQREGAPELVLLDMFMPVMDGPKFLKFLREDIELSKIPVIAVSATANAEDAVGVKEFVKKPIDLNRLLVLVNKYTT